MEYLLHVLFFTLLGLLALASADDGVLAEIPFLRDWLIVGPFPDSDNRTRLTRPFFPNESALRPNPSDSAYGHRWRHVTTAHPTLNLQTLFPERTEHAVCYAHTYVQSPEERDALLCIGSDDGVMVWLNGEHVWTMDALRPWAMDQDRIPIRLAKGWNRLLVKVSQATAAWMFSARIMTRDRKPIPGLRSQVADPEPGPRRPAPEGPPVQVRGLRWMGPPHLGTDAIPRIRIEGRVVNLTPRPERNLRFRLLTDGEARMEVQEIAELPALSEGSVSWTIPVARAFELAVSEHSRVTLEMAGEELADLMHEQELAAGLLMIGITPCVVDGWECYEGDFQDPEEARRSRDGWSVVNPGDPLPSGVCWLRRQLIIPRERTGLPIDFSLEIPGARVRLYLDGKAQGSPQGVSLTRCARPGLQFSALVRVEQDGENAPVFECASLYVADKNAIYLRRNLEMASFLFQDRVPEFVALQTPALEALYRRDARGLRQALAAACRPIRKAAEEAQRYTAYMIPQSHIDMAWLWPWEETIEVCRATYSQALGFIREHPSFVYNQSQAVSYEAMERHYPEVFEGIRQAVAEGRWGVLGGMWVEPDANMPSGEALVRQCLYGQRYFREKLGVMSTVGWLPDTFGHAWSLPQILKKSGMDSFCFYRCGKGHPIFWWEGIDGTRVLCRENPWNSHPAIVEDLRAAERQYGIREIMSVYGLGDHGGGPTREEIERVDAMAVADAFPRVIHGMPDSYFKRISRAGDRFPVIREELNPTFEGCYTSQARTKRNNRRAENLLGAAESFAALAHRLGEPYPRAELREAWKIALFHQFHDILPGSSIHLVYENAEKEYARCFELASGVLGKALSAIAGQADTRGDGIPVVVFNPLSWMRDDVVECQVSLPERPESLVVTDGETEYPAQVITADESCMGWSAQILFVAQGVPSMGFKCFWIKPGTAADERPVAASGTALENEYLRAEVDPASGTLTSLFDKRLRKQVLGRRRHGGLLELFGDEGEMSAWCIGYTGESWTLNQAESIKLIESGPVRAAIQVRHRFGDSSFEQLITLYRGLRRVDFRGFADWHERRKMLKVAFPTSVRAESATFEIPYGAIERPCNGKDVVMQRWADLSDDRLGVSLLNDCKYGCDVSDGVLRLALLRSPCDPDPNADEGTHTWTWSILPHKGDWRRAQTNRRAAELNSPLLAVTQPAHTGPLGNLHSFVSVEPENLVIGALKLAEDSDDLLLRIAESHGTRRARAKIHLDFEPKAAVVTDLLERETGRAEGDGQTVLLPVKRWEIGTIRVE